MKKVALSTALLVLTVQVLAQSNLSQKKEKNMVTPLEKNKSVVLRFNKEVIEQGNMNSFKELVADNVINHAAPAGVPNGPESMSYFIMNVLRIGFPDIKVEILDQIAEADKVTTRKIFYATHTGEFMGIAPTNRKITINVIDIIRLENGKYVEHWGISNISEILNQLSAK
jgi:predicted ester cyclase